MLVWLRFTLGFLTRLMSGAASLHPPRRELALARIRRGASRRPLRRRTIDL